jgi:hypothetical protein
MFKTFRIIQPACFLFKFGCFYFAAVAALAANPTLITFDDLPTPPSPNYAIIQTPYCGLQWSNFFYMDSVAELNAYGPTGYSYGMVSSNNIAFNSAGAPSSLSSAGVFNLNSAYLTAAWNDGLNVEVRGFVGNTLAYDNTYIVNSTAPTLINFNYLGVSSVVFTSSGGTLHAFPNGGHGTQFAMDDLTLTFVPEPSAFVLTGLSAGILIILRRRK